MTSSFFGSGQSGADDPFILSTRQLGRSFGGVHALRGVDLNVRRGSITGLIGPNGSGKTTFFQLVSGMVRGARGEVHLDGRPILGMKPSRIYRRGLARTFQLSKLFPGITVLENLLVAARRHDRQARQRALHLLEQVRLSDYAQVPGSDLSYGQQRLVEFIRALMAEPRLVLLDEPAAGVNPTLRNIMWQMVRRLNRQGVTFIIIEHNMNVIADLCTEVYVLNEGQVIARGDFDTIRNDTQVMEAFFGRKSDHPTAGEGIA